MADPSAIDADAALWVARLHGGSVAEDDPTLATWLAQSTRHRGAYVRALALWEASAPASASAPAEPVRDDVRPGLSRRRMLGAGVAAAGVAALGTGLLLPRGRLIETGTGEILRLPIASGLSVMLDTESAVRVGTGFDADRITLLRGRAVFEVERAIPLAVQTAIGDVIAQRAVLSLLLGTRAAGLLVVQALVRAAVGANEAAIRGGYTATLRANTAPAVEPVAAAEMERMLAWRDGAIVFAGETLSMATATLNRYDRLQLRVAPGALGGERIVGRFRLDDPAGFAAAVGALYRLPVRSEGQTLILGHITPGDKII